MKIPRIRPKCLFDSLSRIRLDYITVATNQCVSAILWWRELELFEMIRTLRHSDTARSQDADLCCMFTGHTRPEEFLTFVTVDSIDSIHPDPTLRTSCNIQTSRRVVFKSVPYFNRLAELSLLSIVYIALIRERREESRTHSFHSISFFEKDYSSEPSTATNAGAGVKQTRGLA